MSLLDALLLEEPTPAAQEIFIALRNDGARGSGTINDPYDGGTRLGPAQSATLDFDPKEVIVVSGVNHFAGTPVPIAVLLDNVTGESRASYNDISFSGGNFAILNDDACKVVLTAAPSAPPGLAPNGLTITAKLSYASQPDNVVSGMRVYWPVVRVSLTNHSFLKYDVVRISDASTSLLNGDFAVVAYGTNDFWCVLTTNPSSAASNVNADCAKLNHRFDELMRSAAANSIIHIGSGTFETRGSCSLYKDEAPAVGFRVRNAQKLRGSGMDATVLRLVHAFDPYNATVAVANDSSLASHIEVSDFTVDCNLPGQPVPAGIGTAPVTCAAAGLSGEYHRLRRIRAINWGSQSLQSECFVLGLDLSPAYPAHGANNVIEDCIVEKPAENNVRESTIISNGASNVAATARGPVVRNNHVNLEYSNGFSNHPIRVVSLTRDAADHTLAHLVTAEPHMQIKSKALVVRGALVGGLLANYYNGVFAITEIVSDTELTYQMYNKADVDPGVTVDASNACIGYGLSNENIGIPVASGAVQIKNYQRDTDNLTVPDVSAQTDRILVTTMRPHLRTANHNVRLAVQPYPPAFNPFNDFAFRVLAVGFTDQNDRYYPDTLVIDVPGGTAFLNSLLAEPGALGVEFHGPAALAGTGCVTEGNSVYDCTKAFYTDTWSTRDAVVRGNYWSNILTGVAFNFRNGIETFPLRHAYSRAGTLNTLTHQGLVATATSATEHGLNTGDLVRIAGARISGVPADSTYNGEFVVTKIAESQFSYTMNAQPTADADAPDPTHLILYGYVSLRRDAGDDKIAVLETESPHGFREGEMVQISGAQVHGVDPNPVSYNDTVSVVSIVSDRIFTYAMKNDPGANADPPTTQFKVTYQARWQFRRLVHEDNIYELYAYDQATSATLPGGIGMSGYNSPPPYTFPGAIFRGNFVRLVNNSVLKPWIVSATLTFDSPLALEVGRSENTLVENNVIEVVDPHTLTHYLSQNTAAFNNLSPSGARLPIFKTTVPGSSYQPDTTVDDVILNGIEDAMICSIL